MTNNNQTLLDMEGMEQTLHPGQSFYAGFWPRLGSLLLDAVISMPVVLAILYLNSMSINMAYYTFVPNILFSLWYQIYLPKRYGGTPGKLLVGIRIIKLDGSPIGWRESILRHLITFVMTIVSCLLMFYSLSLADEATFQGLSWLQQTVYLVSLSPMLFKVSSWVNNIWLYGELIVLLTNKRRRAIHDFIAGTVIVKSSYVAQIEAAIKSDNNTTVQN
ncbi:MAG TPA: RDD family protein [Cytophagaceae bacterium]|jgi:uncharacterized RDD family membrane protein YckC|nr:RDD family protein [Cytophagaceae bacterium]